MMSYHVERTLALMEACAILLQIVGQSTPGKNLHTRIRERWRVRVSVQPPGIVYIGTLLGASFEDPILRAECNIFLENIFAGRPIVGLL